MSDGYFTLPQVSASITFTALPPALITNQLPTFQGRATVLTSASLSAIDPDPSLSPEALIFSVNNVNHGQFNLVQEPEVAITHFTQAQIEQNAIEFIQDGTNNLPEFDLTLNDGRLTAGPFTGNVSLDTIPTLLTDRLTIAPGASVVLGITNIRAVDDVTPSAELVFSVINIQHGYFSQLQNSDIPITQFAQENVIDAGLVFIHDGSQYAPSYFLTVTDTSNLTTQPQKADITFTLPQQQVNNPNTVRNAIIGGIVSGIVGLGFFALKFWLDYKGRQYLEVALEKQEGTGKDQAEFYKNVIRPIAKKILARVRLSSGFTSYISDETTQKALEAITSLVHAIQKQGVEVDLRKLNALEQHRLLDVIARKTRQILVPEVSCCSCVNLSRFFFPEIKPQQIEDKATEIAVAVEAALTTAGFKKEKDEQTVEMEELKEGKESDVGAESAGLASPSMSQSKNYPLRLVGNRDQMAIERRLEGIESQMKTMNQRLEALEAPSPLL